MNLLQTVTHALEDNKAENITPIDVRHFTKMTDMMIIATARSTRHAEAVAEKLERAGRAEGTRALSSDAKNNNGWVLVDFGDIVVHVMTSEMRELYQLEKLWQGDEG